VADLKNSLFDTLSEKCSRIGLIIKDCSTFDMRSPVGSGRKCILYVIPSWKIASGSDVCGYL